MKKFILKISFYALLLFGINWVVGQHLKTYETEDLKDAGLFFSQMRWEEYYKMDNNLDVLILGSSHAFRSYDPSIIEEELGMPNTVFNFGSAAQTPVTSYFVLEEVLSKHQPKAVILDVYVMTFTSDYQLDNGRYNYSPMQDGVAKSTFLKEGFSLKEQAYLLAFPSYVYRNYLKNKLNKQLGKPYIPNNRGVYAKRGFAYNRDTLALEKLRFDNQFSKFKIKPDQITKQNIAYTQRIIERCQAANIPIILVSSAMPIASVEHIENYGEITDFFAEKAATFKVSYLDYNVNRIGELKDEFHYFDDDHMNLAGAQLFSKSIAQYLKIQMNQ